VASVTCWTGREAKALRLALRLSIRAFAEDLGIAARTVTKWEALGAQTTPRPVMQAALDTALARADADAEQRFELLLMDSSTADARFGAQAVDQPVDEADGEAWLDNLTPIDILALAWMVGRLDQHMDRRGTFQLAAGLVAAPVLGVADPIERIAHALTQPTGLTEDMVEYLESRSLGFHRLEQLLPAGQIFRGLLTHLNDITTLLQVCPNDNLRTRLAKTAGETAVIGASIAWELGQTQLAASLYHTTELAARESNDPAILACSAIYQSITLDNAVGAHRTARQKLADARQALPQRGDLATRAWLMAREAEELAAMGDPAAKILIEQASDLLMQARPMQERSWTRCLESSLLTRYRLNIATRLADEAGVYRYVGDLSTLVGESTRKRTGGHLASIGLALVTIGDFHEGIQAGQRSLESIKITEGRYALDKLTQLGAALTGTSSQERDLRENIRATRQQLLSPVHPTQGRQGLVTQ
jgi:transcriptional regulator with XRE-family HTH domain